MVYKENKEINAQLEKFDKRNEKRVNELKDRLQLPKGNNTRVNAENELASIERERLELESRLTEQFKRGTVGTKDKPAAKEEARPTGIPSNANKAPDGHWYAPDPARPGKYLKYD